MSEKLEVLAELDKMGKDLVWQEKTRLFARALALIIRRA